MQPHSETDLEGIRQDLGLPVVHVPYDRHLAVGTGISANLLSEAVRAAAVQIAVEVFERSAGV
jgi:hypothetical protein